MKYVAKDIPTQVNVTSVHPLKQLAQLLAWVGGMTMAAYVGLGVVAGQLALHLGSNAEVKVGQTLLPTVTLNAKAPRDDRHQYLEQLLDSLHQPANPARSQLTVHLHQSDRVNAAVLPGGQVIVTTGLLDVVETENELAFVLAHELGHHHVRDPLKGLGRSLVYLCITTALGLGGNQSGRVPGIIPVTGNLTQLQYNRQQESAADSYALAKVVQHYRHGGHSLDFFARLHRLEQRRFHALNYKPELFSTHPLTHKRIEVLKQRAATQGWSMTGDATPLPALLYE